MALGTAGLLALSRESVGTETAQTMAFTTFVLFQLFNALNARADDGTVPLDAAQWAACLATASSG
ncbi:cation transporting ATPase C-terminal domain-containing protein [Streptomyces sp. YKOK-I1]